MLNIFFRFPVFGVFSLCGVGLLTGLLTENAQAQSVGSLLPLSARSVEVSGPPVVFETVAETVNQQIATEQARLAKPAGLPLASIPIINELLDESGNLDMGLKAGESLPISVSVGDVMGNTGLVFSADFRVN